MKNREGERRRHRRAALSLEVSIVDVERDATPASCNLSESGAFIPMEHPLPVGRRIAIIFSGERCREPIVLQARVCRSVSRTTQQAPGIGVEFFEVPPREHARVKNIVAAVDGNRAILLVADDARARSDMDALLRSTGFDVIETDEANVTKAIAAHHVDCAIIDTHSAHSWQATAKALRATAPAFPLILTAAGDTTETVARAGAIGIFDVLRMPIEVEELSLALSRVLGKTMPDDVTANLPPLITVSPVMQRVWTRIQQVANLPMIVLLDGETGTGKGLLAKWIHWLSPRRRGPFITAGGSLSSDLAENELFGHERGAFTGADNRHAGRIEQANGGTLFLDEIGDFDSKLQLRLLRFLEEHEFERLGGSQTLRSDARIIAATNRNLKELVASGKFREDLFHRLFVFRLSVPPLRERQEDLLQLAYQILRIASIRLHREPPIISERALRKMQEYHWPGNVRELQHALERALVECQGGVIESLDLAHDAGDMAQTTETVGTPSTTQPRQGEIPELDGLSLHEYLTQHKRRIVNQALHLGGSVANAAHLCRTKRTTFETWVKDLGVEVSEEVVSPRSSLLIVDDEWRICKQLSKILSVQYDVTTESDPKEALALLSRHCYDAVLCDLFMPVNGRRLYDLHRELNPESEATFVFMTGMNGDDARKILGDIDAELLFKPLKPEELLATLARTLGEQ